MEVALDGMRQGKILLSSRQREDLLAEKFTNPMLGILGPVRREAVGRVRRGDVQWVEGTYDGLREWIAEQPYLMLAWLSAADSFGHSSNPEELVRPEYQQVVRALERIRDAARGRDANVDARSIERVAGVRIRRIRPCRRREEPGSAGRRGGLR